MVSKDHFVYASVKNFIRINYKKPEDWDSSNPHVVSKPIKPVIFCAYNESETVAYTAHSIYQPSMYIEKDRVDCEEFRWLIQKNNTINGPLITKELLIRAQTGALENTKVKREQDKLFLPFEDVREFLFQGDKLDELFRPQEEDKKVAVTHKVESPKKPSKSLYTSFKVQGCIKTRKYIASNRCNIDIDDVVRFISGKSKNQALAKLNKYTGMSEYHNKKLLELIVREYGDNLLFADKK